MSAVPKLRFSEFDREWEETTLSEQAVSLDSRRKPVKSSERRSGPFPYYGASGIIDYIDDYIFDEETVLLAEDGANIINRSLPISFIARGKYWVNNHAHVYRAKHSSVFLSISLERLDFQNYNTGTTMPKLNAKTCASLPLIVPTPDEQQKIASFLSSVDKKIDLLRQKKDALELYKKGLMQKIFSQEIRFKQEDGSVFPDWEEVYADDILKTVSNRNHDGAEQIVSISQTGGAVYRDQNGIDIIASEESVKNYKIIEPGDFVISLRSFQGGIEYSEIRGICSPAYTVMKPRVDFDAEFFRSFFKTGNFIRRLSLTVVGIRDGKQISFGAFSTVPLPFPSIAEQKKIASFLSATDAKIQKTSFKIEQMETFKKGLLQQMFV